MEIESIILYKNLERCERALKRLKEKDYEGELNLFTHDLEIILKEQKNCLKTIIEADLTNK